jgi:hypothetical protein
MLSQRLAIAIGVASAVVWIGVAGRRSPPTSQIETAVAEIETAVRETVVGTQTRAEQLSQLPGLDSAIATDEETVRDLMTEEVTFRPQPGEIIEIAQVERVGGGVHRLILVPSDGLAALSVSAPGVHLVADGEQLRVTAVVKVEPRGREEIVSGLVGIAHRIDLSRVASRFEALGIPARLETSRGSVAIGNARSRIGAATIEKSLQGPAAAGGRLTVQVPRGIAWPHVIGGLLLLLASVGSAKLLVRRAARAASSSDDPAPVRRERTDIPTDIWTSEDLTPVGEQARLSGLNGSGILLSSRPGDLYVSSSGAPSLRPVEMSGPVFATGPSMTLPSSLFLKGAQRTDHRTPVLPDPDDPWTEEYRRLFREFVKLRRTCSESTDDLDRDRFIEVLHKKRLDLMEQQGAVDVKFRLAFDNGKAAVRFKVQDLQAIPLPSAKGNG